MVEVLEKVNETYQVQSRLQNKRIFVLDKQQGIRIPSQTVCTELYKMGFGATILSPDQVHILGNRPIITVLPSRKFTFMTRRMLAIL